MEVKSESDVAQSCLTLRDPMDCSLPGSSVHGIFQARVPEWGAITFSGKYAYVHTIPLSIKKKIVSTPFFVERYLEYKQRVSKYWFGDYLLMINIHLAFGSPAFSCLLCVALIIGEDWSELECSEFRTEARQVR